MFALQKININKYRLLLLLLVIILAFIFIRQYKYYDLLTCGQDQGVHLMETWQIFTTKKITLLGVASDLKVDGREFYSGPIIHYVALPFLIIFGWDQYSISHLMTALGLVASFFVFWVLRTKYKKTITGLLFLILYAFSPLIVHTDRLFWAPSFMFPISTAIIGLLLLLAKDNKYQSITLFIIGFLLGAGLQIHYPFVFAAIATLVWLKVINKTNFINLLIITAGFVIGFLPIIIFELRHQFYNTQTVLKMIYKNSDLITFSKSRNFYYYSLIPFLFLGIAYSLNKISRKYNLFLIAALIMATLYWYFYTIPKDQSGITMPTGFNCQAYQQMKNIIIGENKTPFNVLDQLTGESRALYLRGILTVSKFAPLSITDYPQADYLYVFTKNSPEDVLESNQWEIHTIKPVVMLNKWHIQNGIYLYQLVKKEINEN